MRILHTSDWHLGQHFMGKSRQAEHQALIDWLLVQVEQQAVDAVLIAGDIFDTGAPPSYARELYNQLVVRLHSAGVALLLLGGNHDSVATLGESRELLAQLSTTVIAAVGTPAEHVLALPLRGRPGVAGCVVCALPFIRARDVVQSQPGQTAQDKQQALQAAIEATYQSVYAAAQALQAELQQSQGQSLPILATGHLTTVGASRSESVREIYVGSLDAFPTSAFPPVDYVALGHIHQPQKVGGLEHIRYCGSPIALSFDEVRQRKQMLLVELNAEGLQAVTPLEVPCFQALVSLTGNLASLEAGMAAAASAGTAAKPVWLEVVVAEDDYLNDLADRVERMTQGLPIELLRVRRLRGKQVDGIQAEDGDSLQALSPEQVFERRLARETLAEPLEQALRQRYLQVLHSLQGTDGEGA